MSIFYQEAAARKRCKCFASALKAAFSICHSFGGKLPEAYDPSTAFDFDFDFDQEEEEIFVSAIINKYMESKSKRKFSNIGIDSFYWALFPEAEAEAEAEAGYLKLDDAEEYFSARSRGVSRCSSSVGVDAFVTAKTSISRCSSLSRIDDHFLDFQHFDEKRRRSIVMELIHCKGWPFGLCRKALLLPPLPKSPTDSWLWTKSKSGRINIKING